MRSVAVTSFAFWTPAGIFLNEPPELGAAGLPLCPWPDAPPLERIHPRARRPHPQAVALVQLAHGLLEARQATASGGVALASTESLSILLGTVSGCARADEEFEVGLEERGAGFGSPSAFVYTLPTSAPAEVTLALGVRGALATVSMGGLSGVASILRAAASVREGASAGCLCGGMELAPRGSGARTGLALFLLEPSEGHPLMPTLEGGELTFDVTAPEGTGCEDSLKCLEELARALSSRSSTGSQTLAWQSSSGASATVQFRHGRR